MYFFHSSLLIRLTWFVRLNFVKGSLDSRSISESFIFVIYFCFKFYAIFSSVVFFKFDEFVRTTILKSNVIICPTRQFIQLKSK